MTTRRGLLGRFVILRGVWPIMVTVIWMAASPRAPFTERDLERICGTCHPMDPVREARLSREDWGLELDKMQVIGAKIRNRKIVLDYLAAHYGAKTAVIPR